MWSKIQGREELEGITRKNVEGGVYAVVGNNKFQIQI